VRRWWSWASAESCACRSSRVIWADGSAFSGCSSGSA
jgi:hypothetical protein